MSFLPKLEKWRWAATGIFSPSSPQMMRAKLKPPCWEQLQKELCHSPKQSSALGQARNMLNYFRITQYISISHLGARTGERRGQGKKGICCLFGWYVCYSRFQEHCQCGLTVKSCGLSHKIEEKKICRWKPSAGQDSRLCELVGTNITCSDDCNCCSRSALESIFKAGSRLVGLNKSNQHIATK